MWKDDFKFTFSHFPKENLIMFLNLIGFCFCVGVVLFLLFHINASFLSFTQFFTQKENFSARAESFSLRPVLPALIFWLLQQG